MGRARHAPLLERDQLLGVLDDLVDAARRGSGSVVLVAGEAGAGKTALLGVFCDSLDGSADVWLGHCDPLSTPRPLSPLLDIADQPGTGLDVHEHETADTYAVFAQLLGRLRDPPRPVALVIEDAHWADDSTLDLLRFLGRRIGSTRAVVAVSYRDDELTTDHPLRSVLGDLSSQPATVRLGVPLLSLGAVRTLAAEASGVVDPVELHSVTGGNAFFVTEVLASGDAVPSSIDDVVRSRLARVDVGARSVIEAVATAPRELEMRHAIVVSGADAGAIDRAVASGMLIVADGNRLRFRHELTRLAVEQSTPAGHRIVLHTRMLTALAEESSGDHALLAHHAKHIGDGGLIVHHARDAARRAAERGAHRQAAELYGDAAAHAGRLPPSEHVSLLIDYSYELYLVDRQDDSLQQAQEAVAVAEASGDDRLRGQAMVAEGRAVWVAGEARRGAQLTQRGVELLDDGEADLMVAEALSVASVQSMLARRHAPSVEFGERSMQMGRQLGSQRLIGRAHIALGTAELVTGDPRRGIDLLLEACEIGRALVDDRLVSSALGMLGSGGGEVREYGRAYDWLEQTIELARSHDTDYTAAYAQAWQARIRCEQGRWDEAVELARPPAAAAPSAAKISPITALGALGRIRVRRGDPDAEEPLRRALTLGADAELQHRWPSLCSLAELSCLRDRPDEAVDLLASAYQEALETDSAWAQGEIGYWMWRAGGITAPPPLAAAPFAAMMTGRWSAAAAEWAAIGCPYEEALSLAEGDEEAMLAALAILDELGARPTAQRLRGRLRDVGVAVPRGPRPSTRAHPAGLTGRQAEVLALMCDGLGNAEIASRLYLTKKTVEHHVAAVMRKLGASTRAEAIAAARAFE